MTQAVIEIGSTGIRLMVAEPVEVKKKKKYNILDRSERPVNIGRDVYTVGYISSESINKSIQTLELYAEQLKGWDIPVDQTIVIATSAVREAKNRDPFVDRIKVRTGFTVKVTDGIEENRLLYLAVAECLKEEPLAVRQSDTFIIDIAGGATEIMLLEKGRIVGAHTMRLGTVIIEQKIQSMMGTVNDARSFIVEYVRNAKKYLSTELNLKKLQQFIVLANEIKEVALFIGRPKSAFLWEIDRDKFIEFAREIKNYTIEECVAKFKLSIHDAQTFQISIEAHRLFLEITGADKVTVPDTSIREGIFLGAGSDNSEITEDFNQQITASAVSLLKKYQGDMSHAEFVRETSQRVFDALEKENGLDRNSRILLEVSAILHDVGMFIGAGNHHAHGKYIVNNSEIFGISREHKALVAMIVSFHRGKEKPQDSDDFRLLPRSSRMTVLKLAAILRISDALDRNHSQHIKKFDISFGKDTMNIHVKGGYNFAMEKLALQEKGDLFEEVFGYKIVLM